MNKCSKQSYSVILRPFQGWKRQAKWLRQQGSILTGPNTDNRQKLTEKATGAIHIQSLFAFFATVTLPLTKLVTERVRKRATKRHRTTPLKEGLFSLLQRKSTLHRAIRNVTRRKIHLNFLHVITNTNISTTSHSLVSDDLRLHFISAAFC